MEVAIGGKINDYLIKLVNPNQILLSIKKKLEGKKLVSEKVNTGYQQEFRQLSAELGSIKTTGQWMDMYRKLVHWEMELEKSTDPGMQSILQMQKSEATNLFSRCKSDNYISWLTGKANEIPIMSHTVLRKNVFPEADKEPVFLVVIDNLRYDQWKIIQPMLLEYFREEKEELFYSILPTATQYARNALFAGLLPLEIQKKYPDKWKNDDDEGGKNLFEKEFLEGQMKTLGKTYKMSYNKITNLAAGKKLSEQFTNLLQNQLNVIVYNFVDMLSHARTEMEVIRELADNEVSYRSITRSWFEHSPLFEILKKVAEKKIKVIITTDHGTVHVKEPSKIVGDRNTNTNLRYKQGEKPELQQ